MFLTLCLLILGCQPQPSQFLLNSPSLLVGGIDNMYALLCYHSCAGVDQWPDTWMFNIRCAARDEPGTKCSIIATVMHDRLTKLRVDSWARLWIEQDDVPLEPARIGYALVFKEAQCN